MTKINLNQDDLKKLTECINDQTEIPQDLLIKLSPGFFDKLYQEGKFDFQKLTKYKIPTIEYAGKRPESIILAQAVIVGEAAPLQVVRTFGDVPDTAWRNMIVQGDNLQFLKTCYLNHDPLIKNKVKGKVKLIYIDPPFGTGDEYGGKNGEMSYSAKTMGAEFIEILRERLIYLREILSADGNIFIRIDYRFGCYIKIIMDEIFGKDNFKNEIVVSKSSRIKTKGKKFLSWHDSIFLYSKVGSYAFFNHITKSRGKEEWRQMDNDGEQWSVIPKSIFHLHSSKSVKCDEKGKPTSRAKIILGKEFLPPIGRRFPSQETIFKLEKEKAIKLNSNKRPIMLKPNEIPLTDDWTDIASYSYTTNYPTENSEVLLERVINACSDSDDLVLDCFAGSGTTAAVAEKLGRRWIMCDFGKHAIYTMQKRIWNIASSKKLGQEAMKNEKYDKSSKPFSIISAGVYDFSRIMNLRKNKEAYINFVLGLFSIVREEKDYASKYKLSNIYAEKENNPVEVYPVWDDEYLKEVRIDEDYLKEIIRATGGRLKGDYYIVTPESCTVVTNTTLKNSNNEDVNIILLKFPYKVLEDVSRHFQIKDQPASAGDINKLISSAGFYFNEEIEIEVEKVSEGFKVNHFSTGILNQNKERYEGLKGLSMMLIDKNYNGQAFNLDQAIYKNEISEEGIVKIEELTGNSYLIAIDKHGNESNILKI